MKRSIIIILCIFIFGGLFLLFFSGIYPTIFEDKITRRDIDNEYVNSDFDGWYEFKLNEDLCFKVPTEWRIVQGSKEEVYLIKTGEQIIAYVTTLATNSSSFSSRKSFFGSCVGKQLTTYERNYTGRPMAVASSSFNEVKATDAEGNSISTYELSLSDGNGYVVIIYHNPMDWTDQQALFEISQAIAFSFYYP